MVPLYVGTSVCGLGKSYQFVVLNSWIRQLYHTKDKHRNQDSSRNQKNTIQGERPDMENRHKQQRT